MPVICVYFILKGCNVRICVRRYDSLGNVIHGNVIKYQNNAPCVALAEVAIHNHCISLLELEREAKVVLEGSRSDFCTL